MKKIELTYTHGEVAKLLTQYAIATGRAPAGRYSVTYEVKVACIVMTLEEVEDGKD